MSTFFWYPVSALNLFPQLAAGDLTQKGRRNMGRPTTKEDLLSAAASGYEELNGFISTMTEKELSTPFSFDVNKKKEAHWKRDKNLRDVLIHLYEWHQLLLEWVRANQNGEDKPFLPSPYNWKNYGKLNELFWTKHQSTSTEEAKEQFKASHREVMRLAETFTNDELFNKGTFRWCGNSALASYFISNTSSHYNWALKKLKEHRKNGIFSS